jgi:hypothetical protein
MPHNEVFKFFLSLKTQIKTPTVMITLLNNPDLNPHVLDEFINDSLLISMSYFDLIKGTLSTKEKSKYYLKHIQAELLISILRRIDTQN